MSNALGLSETYEKNLRQLATYLWKLKDSPFLKTHAFRMYRYAETAKEGTEATDCGSVGCAVGHGPYAGLKKLGHESWNKYCVRMFAEGAFDSRLDDSPIWNHFFYGAWQHTDDTPRGAARRILYALRHGFSGSDYPAHNTQFIESYKKYHPRKDDFVELPRAVLRRLGLKQ